MSKSQGVNTFETEALKVNRNKSNLRIKGKNTQ